MNADVGTHNSESPLRQLEVSSTSSMRLHLDAMLLSWQVVGCIPVIPCKGLSSRPMQRYLVQGTVHTMHSPKAQCFAKSASCRIVSTHIPPRQDPTRCNQVGEPTCSSTPAVEMMSHSRGGEAEQVCGPRGRRTMSATCPAHEGAWAPSGTDTRMGGPRCRAGELGMQV